MDTELAGFITARRYHPSVASAAYEHRFAHKLWTHKPLHGDEEGVEIDMHDITFHIIYRSEVCVG
jgi:hypothetical protein